MAYRSTDVTETEPAEVIEYEYDGETPASIAVIQAISAVEDVDPMEIDLTLYDHVNPEALDHLLADGTGIDDTVVGFTIYGNPSYSIEITDTGRVTIQRYEF